MFGVHKLLFSSGQDFLLSREFGISKCNIQSLILFLQPRKKKRRKKKERKKGKAKEKGKRAREREKSKAKVKGKEKLTVQKMKLQREEEIQKLTKWKFLKNKSKRKLFHRTCSLFNSHD